jgi:hypothetical protein
MGYMVERERERGVYIGRREGVEGGQMPPTSQKFS